MQTISERRDTKRIREYHPKMPERKRNSDIILELYCNGEWLQKRFVWTEKEVIFEELEADSHFDSIPISEIEHLIPVSFSQDPETKFNDEYPDQRNIIQIQTVPIGLENGKSYRIKTYSESDRDLILGELKLQMKSTKQSSGFRILLNKLQEIARQIHDSALFQRICAFLILAV
jgi:hypothetical protein